jgi:DNA-binding NtrC family response regulator
MGEPITESVAHNPEAQEAIDLAGVKILLADDEERLRLVVTMMLEELGAEVVAVDSCERAVALYGAPGSGFHLALLDLRMKGMGGVQAFRELVARVPGARVVLSSGVRPDESLLAELARHGGGFIEKPFDLGQLARAIGAILRAS